MSTDLKIKLKDKKPSLFRRKELLPYILVSPYMLFVMVFVLFPVLFCLFLTFQKWNIIGPMQFIGSANYSRLFHDRLFWKAIGNTLKFLLLHIPLQLIVSLLLAYLLNQQIRAISFFRGSFFLPVIVSGVVITILWQQLLGFDSGVINRLLTSIGIPKIGWLVNPDVAIYSIAVMATWKNVGLYVILFLVGLQTVPPQYYEAAKLEGASRWQQFLSHHLADDQSNHFYGGDLIYHRWLFLVYRTLHHDRRRSDESNHFGSIIYL
jgi:ABC-type sugar transport system permease subunit